MTTTCNTANKLPAASSVIVVPLTLALGLTGCVMTEDGEPITTHSQAVGLGNLPDNGLPLPNLPDNGLPLPNLPDNGLPLPNLPDNGLTSFEFDEWEEWLNDPQRGGLNALLMSYIVRCALDANQVATFEDSLGHDPWVWPGEIGLATGWANGSITDSDRRKVTSCVLSLVNHNAQTVQISQRGPMYTDIVPEVAIFTESEGAFFGDMFATTPVYYSCSAVSNTTLREDGRVCTQTDDSSNSLCQPIEALGTCEDLCDVELRSVNNLSYTVYTNCVGPDGTYAEVTTTSLIPEAADDDED